MPKEVLIHLPTIGSPYLITDKQLKLETIQELVGYPDKSGHFQLVDRAMWLVHGMFCKENDSWRLVEAFRENQHTETYVNENAVNLNLDMNVACIGRGCEYKGNVLYESSPLQGEVYMALTKKMYNKICDKMGHRLKECKWNEDQEEES